MPRHLSQYLVSGIPGLVVVEKDARYARRIVFDALGLIAQGTTFPVLEWNMTKGWKAGGERTEDLLSQSGLPSHAPSTEKGVLLKDAPAKALEQINVWLEGRRPGEVHQFTKGVLILHDMYAQEALTPHFVRAVQELVEALSALQARAVLLTPLDVAMDNPLRSTVVVVEGVVDIGLRYGGLAQGFITQAKTKIPADDIMALLMGLTLLEAEMVLRLVLVDKAIGTIKTEEDLIDGIRQTSGEVKRAKLGETSSNPAQVAG